MKIYIEYTIYKIYEMRLKQIKIQVEYKCTE